LEDEKERKRLRKIDKEKERLLKEKIRIVEEEQERKLQIEYEAIRKKEENEWKRKDEFCKLHQIFIDRSAILKHIKIGKTLIFTKDENQVNKKLRYVSNSGWTKLKMKKRNC
jgi:hypothetical protein